jgi:hypothetical protein
MTGTNGNYDPAILKNGSVLCIWNGYTDTEFSQVGIVADSTYVYGLVVSTPVYLFRCPVGGGTAVLIFQGAGSANYNLNLDGSGTALYWGVTNSSGSTQVYRLVK